MNIRMISVVLLSTICLLAVPRGVSSACENEEKEQLSITTIDQNIYWVNDNKVVKDSNSRLITHENIVKIRVKMPEGPFNMDSSKVRTIRAIQIRWACRDSDKNILYEKTENLTNVQKWQYTEIVEEFLDCSDVEVKFTKSSTAKKMEIKDLTMDTCIAVLPSGACYTAPSLNDYSETINNPSMTNVICLDHCTFKEYAYASTFSSINCFCANELVPNLVAGICVPCPGDLTTLCGGQMTEYITATGL